jgi:type VI secretion system protein VasD
MFGGFATLLDVPLRDRSAFSLPRQRMPLVVVVLFALGLAGCAPAPEPEEPDTIVTVVFAAAPDLNPDVDGRPSPAVVRVFALTGEDAFRTASYFELRDDAEVALGDTFVSERDLLINPGVSVERRIVFPNEARVLGVMVDYQNIETAVWRAFISIRSGEETNLRAMIGGDEVRLGMLRP